MLNASHTLEPRVSTVEQNAAYPPALNALKKDKAWPKATEPRPIKYRNNLVEPAHRFIQKCVRPGLGFGPFYTAWQTLKGYEVMNMIRKGQMKGAEKGDVIGQLSFINEIFGVAA